MRGKLLAYLQAQPKARERKNKDRAIVNLLIKDNPQLALVDKDTLIKAIRDYTSYDRQWRKILDEHEALRGSDYGDKEQLEQEAQIALGYGA